MGYWNAGRCGRFAPPLCAAGPAGRCFARRGLQGSSGPVCGGAGPAGHFALSALRCGGCGTMFCAAGSGGGALARSAGARDRWGALPLRFVLWGLPGDILRCGACGPMFCAAGAAGELRPGLRGHVTGGAFCPLRFALRGLPGDILRGGACRAMLCAALPSLAGVFKKINHSISIKKA